MIVTVGDVVSKAAHAENSEVSPVVSFVAVAVMNSVVLVPTLLSKVN